MYLKAAARMQNDQAAQALMIHSLAAQGRPEGINSTYRKLTEEDGETKS